VATKLTLRLDEKVINKAKKAAKIKGVSLSKLVSDYFQSVALHQKKEIVETPVLSEISGILSSKADSKKLFREYRKHIEEKYL
jgi:hypothetical protein